MVITNHHQNWDLTKEKTWFSVFLHPSKLEDKCLQNQIFSGSMLIHWRLSNKTASIIMDNLNSSNTNWGGSQQQGGSMISNTRRANNNRDLSSESRVLPMAMARGFAVTNKSVVLRTRLALTMSIWQRHRFPQRMRLWFCKGVQENAAVSSLLLWGKGCHPFPLRHGMRWC